MNNQTSEAKLLKELDTLIRARYTLLAVGTYEEERLKEILLELVTLEKHREKPLYFWSRTSGITKIVEEKGSGVPLKETKKIPDTQDRNGQCRSEIGNWHYNNWLLFLKDGCR